MKSTLITLLVASATLFSPGAEAQIANVRLYGSFNVDLEFVNGATCNNPGSPGCGAAGNERQNPTVVRVSSNSSRFGIRGSEYLGQGQVAIFQIESSVQADTSGGSPAGRETFVGLQGDWGTLKLGHFLTPYDDILPIFGNTPTLTTSMLSTAAIWAQGPLSKVQGGFDARLGNSIRYETPPMGGFSGELQYSTRDFSLDDVDTANNGDHISELRHANVVGIGAFYSKGPIDFGPTPPSSPAAAPSVARPVRAAEHPWRAVAPRQRRPRRPRARCPARRQASPRAGNSRAKIESPIADPLRRLAAVARTARAGAVRRYPA